LSYEGLYVNYTPRAEIALWQAGNRSALSVELRRPTCIIQREEFSGLSSLFGALVCLLCYFGKNSASHSSFVPIPAETSFFLRSLYLSRLYCKPSSSDSSAIAFIFRKLLACSMVIIPALTT